MNLKIFSFKRKITLSRWEIQSGIILLVVLVAMITAYWGSKLVMLALIALPFGLAGLYIFLRRPNLIFVLILLCGMFTPFSGPGGINASIIALILLLVSWVMDMLLVKKELYFIHTRTIRPLLYFIIVSLAAFAVGQISWFPFSNQAPLDTQLGGLAIYILLPLTMLIFPNLIKNVYWIKLIFWIFIGLSMVYVTARVLKLAIFDSIFQHGYTANSMLWTWMITLLAGQILYNHELSWYRRGMMMAFILMILYVTVIQANDWKSGWFPGGVALAVLLGLRYKKLTLIVLPFVFAVGISLTKDLISTDLYSWGTRLDAWLVVLDISRTSPIIGLGFANYYWYAKLFPIRGYFIRFNSHSQFVDIIAQTGILGLVCFLWIFLEVGRLAWKLMNQLPDGFEKGYAYGVFAGVFGSIVAAFLVDWLLPFAYNIGLDGVRASVLPWIFFGGLVSIEQIHLAKQITDSVGTRIHNLLPIN